MGLPATLWNDRGRVAFASLGAVAVAVYFVLPGESLAESWLYQGFSFAAFALLAARAVRSRGRVRLAFLCFAAGVFCFFGGDAIWLAYRILLSRDAAFPSVADVLYLAGYPFLIAGTFFAFSGRQGRSLGKLLEAGIVIVASGLLIWLIVIAPVAEPRGVPLLERLTSVAYPTMDFLILAALSQSLLRRTTRGSLLVVLAAALALQTAADLVYSWISLSSLYTSGSWVDAGWLLTYVLFALASLTREPREHTTESPARSGLPWVSLTLMFLALLAPPLTLVVESTFDLPLELWAVLPASLLIAVLVFARLVLLLRELVVTQGMRQKQTQALRVQNGLLEASERERARLLARTTEVAEHERMRIATELHDGPIQKLTVVAFKLDRLERRIARNESDVEPLIREIRGQLQTEMSALRRVMSELRPPILDERNLAAALNDCAEQVFADARIAHQTTCDLGPEPPAPEVETAVYRVVREALINVRRNGSATRVDVEVARRGESLHLLITDDSGGFDDSLLAMEERIGSVGGIFAFATVGMRTRIEATLPWKPRVASAGATDLSLSV
jgi:signal transduction histidine kinase